MVHMCSTYCVCVYEWLMLMVHVVSRIGLKAVLEAAADGVNVSVLLVAVKL